MAAGLSLPEDKVEEFRRRLNENCTLTTEDLTEQIVIDVPMPLDYINEALIEQLDVLEPFGKGNEKPVFADKNIGILSMARIGKNKDMLRLRLKKESGCIMESTMFRNCDDFEAFLNEQFSEGEVEKAFRGLPNNISIAITYYPSINEFRGNRSLQVNITGYQ